MADNKIANAIKFLKGEEKSLPATKTDGQVYFAYKNVGTAEKPSYTGAIYIDTPIGGTQNRIKMTANADVAEYAKKANADSQGNLITGYLRNASLTGNADSQTFTFTAPSGTKFDLKLNGVSDSQAGLVTSGDQIFPGYKTLKLRAKPSSIIGSNAENSDGWYKVATSTMSGYGNTNILYYVKNGYSSEAVGILDFEMRSNDTSIQCWACKWLVRGAGFTSGMFRVVIDGMTWTLYAYQPVKRWGRISITEISNTDMNGDNPNYKITYYNSTTKETTEPDKTISSSDGGQVYLASKATNDGNGQNIANTYIKSLSYSNDGKQLIATKGSGDTSLKLSLPIASTTKSGIVTADAQSFGGTKTFTTINSTNLTITGSSGFSYTGIETATGNKARPVWFAYDGINGKPVVNANFTYNPATQTLSVANLSGTAQKASNDDGGQNIRNTYVKYKTIKFSATADKVYLLEGNGAGAVTATSGANISTAIIPAATDKTAGVITTGTQTFNGNKTFNNSIIVNDYLASKTITNTNITKLILLSTPQGNIGDTSHTISVYFKALLKWICSNYPNKIECTFLGRVAPNSMSNTSIFIYNTSKIDATSGLPEYSSGSYTHLGGNIYVFGTYNYAFYFRESLMSDSKYAGSASSGGAATSTNAINWVAGNEVRFTRPSSSNATSLHIGYKWADGTSSKLINEYLFEGGDGNTTQVTASQFNGSLNGNANTATALTSSAGSSTQPVYFSGGKPVAIGYTIAKSVPSNAVFTDTWRPLGTTANTACAGNDSRLSNARPASDVYAWAKASSKPSYSWGEITGKPSTFTPSSHTHYSLSTIGDQRSTATTPDSYHNAFIFQGLKNNSTIGITDGDTYSYVLGLRGWNDASGGDSHELAFNSKLGILTRNGGSTWNAWRRILDSSNYTSYTVTKSGSGASGTWGISVTGSSTSCTGNAATATKLQTARTISLTGSITGSGTFDGSGNLSIITSTNHSHSQYLPLAGGTLTGITSFQAGTNVWNAIGTAGTDGYIKVATIKITNSYANAPIEISFSRRGDASITRLAIEFTNADSKDPDLNAFLATGTTRACWMAKTETSTWGLYIKKTENYDNIDVTSFYVPKYSKSNISIAWTDEQVSAVPKGAIQALFGWSVNYANSANTATRLQTTCTINGTSFNGTSNITTSYWGTARNIYIRDCTNSNTGTAVSVNGSTNAYLSMPSTARFTGSVGIGNGSGATLNFYTAANTIGAKIVAYSDRIEFVFA